MDYKHSRFHVTTRTKRQLEKDGAWFYKIKKAKDAAPVAA